MHMNRRNYQRELDRILERSRGEKPRLLLHSCCGPCSSSVLEYLTPCFDVTLLWYNPNLYPEEEFVRRRETLKILLEKMGLSERVQLLEEPWRNEEYDTAVRGLEAEKEGGKRCEVCFRLRLAETARLARENGFEYFCTTLTLSRHKNADLINSLGEEAAEAAGVKWLPSDFKKQGREMRSSELSEQYGLYRQRYCGCAFSLRKREEENRIIQD